VKTKNTFQNGGYFWFSRQSNFACTPLVHPEGVALRSKALRDSKRLPAILLKIATTCTDPVRIESPCSTRRDSNVSATLFSYEGRRRIRKQEVPLW
jgi:hypothetical protein